MITIYEMRKETADNTFKKCDKCNGRIICPESNCIWCGVLANGGEGKIYCTIPQVQEDRVTRFGM